MVTVTRLARNRRMWFLMFIGGVSLAAGAGETLYNGIVLPDTWPPDRGAPSHEPMAVPCLDNPPEVISIDVGRQLFVDDFLIAETTLRRTYHHAEYYAGNPVLAPDKPWETTADSQGHPAPTAMVFSDGVWYDPADRLYKMWYMAGYCSATAYATSHDGIHWEKPPLDVVPGTNIVHTEGRDSGTVWLDLEEKDPARRYKLFIYKHPKGGKALSIYFSPDGVHWGECAGRSGPLGDRSTVFYNPFRKVWVYGLRDYSPADGRYRRYWENADVLEASRWEAGQAPFWVGADTLDPPRADLKTPCELYNLDAVAYESILLGLFDIWRGQPQDRAKPNELCLGFSRDGFHWYRPDRTAFLPVSEKQGDWNWGNVQSAGGGCLIAGDQLYFYMSGRKGVPGSPASGICATGLATLRRDGFASMDADANGGTLTTRPLRFSGKYLFVNADAKGGLIQAEVINDKGEPIAPFTKENCLEITADGTAQRVQWENAPELAACAGKPIRFRFHAKAARLFAFWVSPEASGASHGYTAAGGPGFTGPTDTVGVAKTL